ncbi:TetR/AcrR family transcriptional regulator [Lacrimispora sp. 38-1]|uniref:TetR/AcrR family transcriptional regulator n=1 Tax=Lacrimispora sp. 38-1 TaxID=3125778 RepID=UPI003CF7AC2D
MPTQRFLHLPDIKREKIKRAAIREFSKFSFSDVSINQIIKEADISRGSFYTYFDDKEDLLAYLLRDFQETCKRWFFQNLELCEGNIYQVFWNSILVLINYGREQQDFIFYKNIFLDAKLMTETSMIGFKDFFNKSKEEQELVRYCFEKLDHIVCPVSSSGELSELLELLLFLVAKSMSMYFMESADIDEILHSVKYQFQVIEEGVRIRT